jgi:nicotinate-nucleotide--dimethylbenzimidazole phosphoribosyltransferase
MGRQHAEQLIEAGATLAHELADRASDIIATGDMGIGNSTAAAALTAVFTGRGPAEVAGRGAGLDDAGLQRKVAVIARALEVNRLDAADPVAALAGVGGCEIAFLTGLMLGAAERRVAVALDGFISTSAALVAQGIEPRVTDFTFSCHMSAEPGHRAALEKLGLRPLLDLGMRLGEGSGAALGLQLIEAAVRLHNEMATFSEAGISDRPQAGAESL